jgi:hypothetical protein
MVLILFRYKGLFRPAIRLLGLPEIRWRFVAAMTALLLFAIALPDGLTKIFTLLLLLYIALAFYIAETISRNRRRPRVVMKVRKSLPQGRISNRQMRQIFPSWSRITATSGRVSVSRMFSDAELQRLDEHISRAIRLDVTYRPTNFSNYLLVRGKVNADLTGLVAGLSDIPEVESVYLDRTGLRFAGRSRAARTGQRMACGGRASSHRAFDRFTTVADRPRRDG